MVIGPQKLVEFVVLSFLALFVFSEGRHLVWSGFHGKRKGSSGKKLPKKQKATARQREQTGIGKEGVSFFSIHLIVHFWLRILESDGRVVIQYNILNSKKQNYWRWNTQHIFVEEGGAYRVSGGVQPRCKRSHHHQSARSMQVGKGKVPYAEQRRNGFSYIALTLYHTLVSNW